MCFIYNKKKKTFGIGSSQEFNAPNMNAGFCANLSAGVGARIYSHTKMRSVAFLEYLQLFLFWLGQNTAL